MEIRDDIQSNLKQSVENFHLPRYHEIPDVGLFLEQTVRLINQYLQPLGGMEITPSMVSNYVKHKLIDPPIKKQYSRDQIAYLVFMAVAKTVMPLEDIRTLFVLQRTHYAPEVAYNYLCEEFENVLQYIFNIKPALDTIGHSNTPVKMLLRTIITTIAHKIHLQKYFEAIKQEL